MMKRFAIALGALGLLAGCEAMQKTHDTISQTTSGISAAKSDVDAAKQAKKDADAMSDDAKKAMSKTAVVEIKPSGNATTQPANKNVKGTATFSVQADGKVRIVVAVTGLAPNSKHGIHIHEKGDLSKPDLSSAGGHFNPAGHKHGAMNAGHAGDLGNLEADQTGAARIDVIHNGISLGTGEANDVAGRSVIVHATVDDLATDPAGNSGARVAGGVITLK